MITAMLDINTFEIFIYCLTFSVPLSFLFMWCMGEGAEEVGLVD